MDVSVNPIEKDSVMVTLQDFPAHVSTILPSITFWLTPDEADKLAFQLSSLLQDMEINKKMYDPNSPDHERDIRDIPDVLDESNGRAVE